MHPQRTPSRLIPLLFLWVTSNFIRHLQNRPSSLDEMMASVKVPGRK